MKDKLEDMKQQQDEVNDFFISAAKSGDDDEELMGELDALEAEFEEEELAKMGVGSGALPNVGISVGASVGANVPAQRNDEDELRQLE